MSKKEDEKIQVWKDEIAMRGGVINDEVKVKDLKKLNKGHKSYYGGWDYWVSSSELGQSITRKEAYAKAFANVLKEWGINAMMMSRLD